MEACAAIILPTICVLNIEHLFPFYFPWVTVFVEKTKANFMAVLKILVYLQTAESKLVGRIYHVSKGGQLGVFH